MGQWREAFQLTPNVVSPLCSIPYPPYLRLYPPWAWLLRPLTGSQPRFSSLSSHIQPFRRSPQSCRHVPNLAASPRPVRVLIQDQHLLPDTCEGLTLVFPLSTPPNLLSHDSFLEGSSNHVTLHCLKHARAYPLLLDANLPSLAPADLSDLLYSSISSPV